MASKNRLPSSLAFLLIFLAVTLFINFLHTEHSLDKDVSCPACHFLNSTLQTAQIFFFYLPPPSFLGVLESPHSLAYASIVLPSTSSRSPPSA